MEIGDAARLDLVPRVPGLAGLPEDVRAQLALNQADDSVEQVGLRPEVVVQGALRHAAGNRDVVRRGRRIAIAQEHVPRDADELAPRRLGPLPIRPAPGYFTHIRRSLAQPLNLHT